MPLSKADPVIIAVKNSLEGPMRTSISQITPRWAAKPVSCPPSSSPGPCPARLAPSAKELGLCGLHNAGRGQGRVPASRCSEDPTQIACRCCPWARPRWELASVGSTVLAVFCVADSYLGLNRAVCAPRATGVLGFFWGSSVMGSTSVLLVICGVTTRMHSQLGEQGSGSQAGLGLWGLPVYKVGVG